MRTLLTVGKVARQAGINMETIRYYERSGLLRPNGYRDSGYRLYNPGAVRRIWFVKNAQELGFTLKEIYGLLRLRMSRRARCESVKKSARAKLESVEEKTAKLEAIRKVLKNLIRVCHSERTTNHCPLLGSLEVDKR
jgi:DNA-binding transcriptional MerR regulator